MHRLVVFTAFLAAFVVASPAGAKGPVTVEICGQDDCTTVRDNFADPHGPASGILGSDSLEFADSPPPGPYYTVAVEAAWMERDTAYFVPGVGVLRVGSNWLALSGADAAGLRAAIGNLAPFPSPRLTRATVDGRRAADAAPYFELLGTLPPADYPPPLARAVQIVLRADRPNPWTDVRRPFDYYPRQKLLHRQTEWLRVPSGLAAVIERDGRLVAPPTDSRSNWPSYLAVTLLSLGLLAVVAHNLRARRRIRPQGLGDLGVRTRETPE
jgi:hypothetical protein